MNIIYHAPILVIVSQGTVIKYDYYNVYTLINLSTELIKHSLKTYLFDKKKNSSKKSINFFLV